MPGFFSLLSPMSRHHRVEPEDVTKTKRSLNQLGFFKIPEFGLTDMTDEDMFKGIEGFQKKNKLRVDGIMSPEGETAAALDKALKQKREADLFAAASRPPKTPAGFAKPPAAGSAGSPNTASPVGIPGGARGINNTGARALNAPPTPLSPQADGRLIGAASAAAPGVFGLGRANAGAQEQPQAESKNCAILRAQIGSEKIALERQGEIIDEINQRLDQLFEQRKELQKSQDEKLSAAAVKALLGVLFFGLKSVKSLMADGIDITRRVVAMGKLNDKIEELLGERDAAESVREKIRTKLEELQKQFKESGCGSNSGPTMV